MSADEQAQAIGKLIMDAAESKRKLAALTFTVITASDQLQKVALMMSGICQGVECPPSEVEGVLAVLPSAAQLGQLTEQHAAEARRSRDLTAQVAKLGI